MAKKLKEQHVDLPIDKMEAFLQTNFKKLLTGAAVVIGIFVVSYGVWSWIDSSKGTKLNALGSVESTLRSNLSEPLVKDFAAMAPNVGDSSEYATLRAAQLYLDLGKIEEAKALLAKVNGDFAELRDSMMADLGETVDSKKYLAASLGDVWYYRAVLAAKPEEKGKLLDEYKTKYPTSKLYETVAGWGAQ